MQKNCLGDRACASIVAALRSNPYINTLNLSDNRMGIKSSVELRDTLSENITLTKLDIAWNHIRPQDLNVLSQGLRANNSLKTLSLAWNGIGDKFVEPVDNDSAAALNQTQKSAASKPASPQGKPSSPRRPVIAGAAAGNVCTTCMCACVRVCFECNKGACVVSWHLRHFGIVTFGVE